MSAEKIKRIFGYLFEGLVYFLLYPVARLIYKNREIYLFAERGVDARDNAYHLYRYFKEKHSEKESYFVITKDSPDRNKLLPLGNIVSHRSLKHYLLFIGARYKISTHIMGFSPDMNFYASFRTRLHIYGKLIFLQHGITKDDLPSLYCERVGLSMFVCGAKPEYDFINETFHYKSDEVKYTGFARFDALSDFETKNQILIMPTWRFPLKFMTAQEVENSVYVQRWNGVLNNDKLCEFLEKSGTEIIFYPHFEMQKYLYRFLS